MNFSSKLRNNFIVCAVFEILIIHVDTKTVVSHDRYVWNGGKLASNIMFLDDHTMPKLSGGKNFITCK